MPKVAIIDIGIGNIFSLQQAVVYLGATPVVLKSPIEIEFVDAVILPGVGTFEYAMNKLVENGFDVWIKELVQNGCPLLGICLGMQLLFDKSFEGGREVSGLGFFSGQVVRIGNPEGDVKLPNMGWRRVKKIERSNKEGLSKLGYINNNEFYFMHSYEVVSEHDFHELYMSEYEGKNILSCIRRKNVIATQFHPEKSGEIGLALLQLFIYFRRQDEDNC